MNLYLLEQSERGGYDTYDSMVVAAESEEQAKQIHPDERYRFLKTSREKSWEESKSSYSSWASSPEKVTARFIGVADPSIKVDEIICASFNAG